MQRIDGPYAVSTKPALSPPAGSPGFFSGGDPARGVKATRVTKDWLNRIQEEICNVIEAADITLDRTDDTQLLQALRILFGLSEGGGSGGGSGDSFGGYITEFRQFYRPTPPEGWLQRNGALIVNAENARPKLWAALQQSENAWLLKNQAEWNALNQAQPWNGIGGAPFFVLDPNAKTIRLPDTRGMYMEDAGFDGLTVGGVHGDAIRNITGYAVNSKHSLIPATSGCFLNAGAMSDPGGEGSTHSDNDTYRIGFDASRVVPTANVNRPRAFGMLGCVCVGTSE